MDNIVFDVAGLENVDATFLRFLANLRSHAAKVQSASVELVGMTPALRRVLETSGVLK